MKDYAKRLDELENGLYTASQITAAVEILEIARALLAESASAADAIHSLSDELADLHNHSMEVEKENERLARDYHTCMGCGKHSELIEPICPMCS